MKYAEFLLEAMKLKAVKRSGWVYKEINHPESVADHSFGVALLAMTVELPKGIDREKLIKMALVHDMIEVKLGDIMWEAGKESNEEKIKKKQKLEIDTAKELFNREDTKPLFKIMKEFAMQKTSTAKFLRELDKLEFFIQSIIYEKIVGPSKINDIWKGCEQFIKSDNLKGLFEELSKFKHLPSLIKTDK